MKKKGDEDLGVKKPGDEDKGVRKPDGEDLGVKKPVGEVLEVEKKVGEDLGVKKPGSKDPTVKKTAVKKPAVKKPTLKKNKIKPPTKSFSMSDQTIAKVTSISGIPMTSVRVGGWKETPTVHATSLKSEQANNEDSTVINLTISPRRSDSITSASSIDQEESSQKSGSLPLTPPPGSPAKQSPSKPSERRQLLLARQAITQLQIDR